MALPRRPQSWNRKKSTRKKLAEDPVIRQLGNIFLNCNLNRAENYIMLGSSLLSYPSTLNILGFLDSHTHYRANTKQSNHLSSSVMQTHFFLKEKKKKKDGGGGIVTPLKRNVTSLQSSAVGRTPFNLAALWWHNADMCLGAVTSGQLSHEKMMVRRESSTWRGRRGTGRAVGRERGKSVEPTRDDSAVIPHQHLAWDYFSSFPITCKFLHCQMSASPGAGGL